jgi:hypothetical protein
VAFAAWAEPAQSANLTVTVNGVSSAPGTYNSAYVFQATCDGTEATNSSGDPAIFSLKWQVQSDDTIFWDTAADCTTGNTVTNDAGAIISGNDVWGNFSIDPAGSASNYGVGDGNVEINMRTVFASAFPRIYGDIFDGGDACVPPERGTLYICVSQEEVTTSALSGTTQTTLFWYMAVTYDTFTPEAPTGITGQSGDSNVTVGWDFSDNYFPSQDISFNVYYQLDPNGFVPDDNGSCSAASDAGLVDGGGSDAGTDTAGWDQAQFAGTLASGTINGLSNGVCYDFVVQAVLDDGTYGEQSSEVVVAPVMNYDFWRLYQLDAGGDTGGLHCQSAGGPVGLLGVLAVLLGLRRRRVRIPLG